MAIAPPVDPRTVAAPCPKRAYRNVRPLNDQFPQTNRRLPGASVKPAPAQATVGDVERATGMESITVCDMRRLIRVKNSPSAAAEISAAPTRQEGSSGDIVSILRNAPSVYIS
ncbi:hypothetical protein AA103196_1209 [Ameyamaea chiangmaiensis NBRC 103196]|uniref:Uncharacterized protein n=1 Tax=Ameyamaea chiangmaiensis TaxID=442969 RepID=A0A850P5Z5_9PROT|nr:hypothetical protein [Ameyamaea chiangmaiensis]MBS4075023.1 hypothetical protein [Ameyamaea chiangmaiensis]NVN40065.1 hypothetical protein [Ameyamaea chiangmaiensis]GBQ65743.1 hypothetical protein AA103196_1209 [Ameyamaea chiangmaiensis NBRC 103196]